MMDIVAFRGESGSYNIKTWSMFLLWIVAFRGESGSYNRITAIP